MSDTQKIADLEARVARMREAMTSLAGEAGRWDDMRSGAPEAPDSTPVTVLLGQLRALDRLLTEDAGLAAQSENARLREALELVAGRARIILEDVRPDIHDDATLNIRISAKDAKALVAAVYPAR